MKLSNDLNALGEFIGGLMAQQKKEIVEELRKEIKTSTEQLRKEIHASQEQTVKDVTGYFQENVMPLLGEYDARLEHQEAHTTHPPGAPTGL